MNGYRESEKRVNPERRRLTEEEINEIAIVTAEKAMEYIYSEVGKGVLRKLFWIGGIIIVSIAVWLIKSDKWFS